MTDKMQSYIENKIEEIIKTHQGKADRPCLEEIQKLMPTYGIEMMKNLIIIK